jgi:hypothetical protein
MVARGRCLEQATLMKGGFRQRGGLWVRTQGLLILAILSVVPLWADVRLGAVREGERLQLVVSAEQSWEGRLVFDVPRHKVVMKLPVDYPRINQFPEWFTVEAERRYGVTTAGDGSEVVNGKNLRAGWAIRLKAGEERRIVVEPK